jgi:hypothetical protein
LFAVVVAQIVLASYAFMYTEEVSKIGQNTFEKLWIHSSNRQDDEALQGAIHATQRILQCCGRTGPSDWGLNILHESCCSKDVKSCDPQNAFQNGCEEAMGRVVVENWQNIAWIAVIFDLFVVRTKKQ